MPHHEVCLDMLCFYNARSSCKLFMVRILKLEQIMEGEKWILVTITYRLFQIAQLLIVEYM